MYYEVMGSGEPVIWVSGLGDDYQSWLPFAKDLSKNFRCIVFDNRGVGQSNKPDFPYSIKMMADDTAALIEELGLDHVHVIGHSMGGAITQELAIGYPKLLKTITLLATWPKTDALMQDIIEGLKFIIECKELKNNRTQFMRHILRWCLTFRFYEKKGAMEEVLKLIAENPHPQPTFAFLRQADACIHHNTSSRLNQIKIPTHIIVGDEDILTPPRFSKTLAGEIKGSKLTIIKECGHGYALEKPKELEEAILQFLESNRT